MSLNFERIVAGSERDLVEKSVDYMAALICAFQERDDGCFVMGISGPNGRVRRARALDTFTALAACDSVRVLRASRNVPLRYPLTY